MLKKQAAENLTAEELQRFLKNAPSGQAREYSPQPASVLEKKELILELVEELEKWEEKMRKAEASVKVLEEKLKKAEGAAAAATKKSGSAANNSDKEIKELKDKLKKAVEAEKEKATELEDLIMVLSDLEEKRSKDKVCLSIVVIAVRGACGLCR